MKRLIRCRCFAAQPFSEILLKVCRHCYDKVWNVCFHSSETTLKLTFYFIFGTGKSKKKQSDLSHKTTTGAPCCSVSPVRQECQSEGRLMS